MSLQVRRFGLPLSDKARVLYYTHTMPRLLIRIILKARKLADIDLHTKGRDASRLLKCALLTSLQSGARLQRSAGDAADLLSAMIIS